MFFITILLLTNATSAPLVAWFAAAHIKMYGKEVEHGPRKRVFVTRPRPRLLTPAPLFQLGIGVAQIEKEVKKKRK